MKKTLILWKNIIANPFDGYKGLDDGIKIIWPLLIIIILFFLSVSMIMPIMTSPEYSDAVARVQIAKMAEQGRDMSAEQKAAVQDQIKSPLVRKVTIISTFGGGLIGFMAIQLIIALLLKLIVSAIKKDPVRYGLVFKLLLFTALISMVQSIVKAGITVSGDWHRAMSHVSSTSDLQYALTSPVSLAALLDPSVMNRQLFFVADFFTDVFNWIYYIFLYAGLKVSLGLEKKPALIITAGTAALSLVVSLLFTLIK